MQLRFKAVSLSEMGIKHVGLTEIKAAMVSKDRSPIPISCWFSDTGGSANSRFVDGIPSSSLACQGFSNDFRTLENHSWEPQCIFLVDRPCYIVVRAGVVINEDGRIILDTVYPSTGELSVSRVLGSDLSETNLQENLREAPDMGAGVFVPLMSRWSEVYFHAVTECLIQDQLFCSNHLSEFTRYISPSSPKNAQHRVIETVEGKIEKTNSPVVRVARAAFSSVLFSHSLFSIDFLNFVQKTKLRVFAGGLPLDRDAWEKVYVTRASATARRMTNEGELMNELTRMGFRVVDCGSMRFDDQVRLFQNARLVMGPHGAGLTNAAFARAGSTLCELRGLNREGESPYWGVSYLKLSSIMGFRYCLHVSDNPPNSDEWQANIAEIVLLARKLLGM